MKALRSFLCEWDATQEKEKEKERSKVELAKKAETGTMVTKQATPSPALQGKLLVQGQGSPASSGLGAMTKLQIESATRRALQLVIGVEAKEERRRDTLQVRHWGVIGALGLRRTGGWLWLGPAARFMRAGTTGMCGVFLVVISSEVNSHLRIKFALFVLAFETDHLLSMQLRSPNCMRLAVALSR